MILYSAIAYAINPVPGFPKPIGEPPGGGGQIFYDLDQDGINEVIVTGNGKVFAWNINGTPYLNNPDGTFFSLNSNFTIFAPTAVGDITGDGIAEVVIAANRLYVVDSNGNLIIDLDIGGKSYAAPVIADIDEDGIPEIIGTGRNPGLNHVYAYSIKNNGGIIKAEAKHGFPTGNVQNSSPAIGRLDSNGLQLVYGEKDHVISAIYYDGTALSGFPVNTGSKYGSNAAPAIGDIDGDDNLDIVIGAVGFLLVFGSDGKFEPGWPQETDNLAMSSPALCDIDGNGIIDAIFVGSYEGDFYGFDSKGNRLSGFPKNIGSRMDSPVIADIDNDNVLEVVVGSKDGNLYAWKITGQAVDGFPIDLGSPIQSSPIIGTDGNGHTLLGISIDNEFYLYDLGPNTYNPDMQPWPMAKHDPQRTGNYHYDPNEQAPDIDKTPPQWTDGIGIQEAFQVGDNTVRIHWNKATDTESEPVKYSLYISEVFAGSLLQKETINNIKPMHSNLASGYDYEFEIDPSVSELKENSIYRFQITAEDSASNETVDTAFRDVHILDFMTVSEINATLMSNPSDIIDKEIVTEIMGLSHNSSLLVEAVEIGHFIYDILTLKSLGDLVALGSGIAGLDPTAFAKTWLKERTTYRLVVGTNPNEDLDWYQVVSPVDIEPLDQISKGWPVIARVKVIEKKVLGENHRTIDVLSFHHNPNRFDFLPGGFNQSEHHIYSFDNLNNSEINQNLVGVKGALIGCIESRRKEGQNVILKLHNPRSTDEVSRPVYAKMPFTGEKIPAPHAIIGIYGVIGTYQGSYCIETTAEDLHLIAGIKVTLPEEGWDGIGGAYIVSAVESPVDLHIYDSLGNHTGAVYGHQGSVTKTEFGIPGSLYLGQDFHPELILITNPRTGTYRQKLIGTEDGTYSLTTIAVDRNGDEIYQIQRKDKAIGKNETDFIKIPVFLNESGELIADKSLAVDPNIENQVPIPNHVIHQHLPDKTMLLQSFPNPCNPETWIPYQLAQSANVIIRIHTIDGRLIKALNLGYMQAGYHTEKQTAAYWNGRNEYGERAISGIYYYSIQAGNYSAAKKLVLAE